MKRKASPEPLPEAPPAKLPRSAQPRSVLADADGAARVRYWPDWLDEAEARATFDDLYRSTPWTREQVRRGGVCIDAPRMTAFYGDPGVAYTYAGMTRRAQPWTPRLLALKTHVERTLGEGAFTFALLNLYASGRDSIGWHADRIDELVPGSTIASVSLGATRDFQLKPKEASGDDGGGRRPLTTLPLAGGSLLTMEGAEMQARYVHRVPPRAKAPGGARINVTFRRIKRPPPPAPAPPAGPSLVLYD